MTAFGNDEFDRFIEWFKEQPAEQFHMLYFINNVPGVCGSPACLFGHMEAYLRGNHLATGRTLSSGFVATAFGLPITMVDRMLSGRSFESDGRSIGLSSFDGNLSDDMRKQIGLIVLGQMKNGFINWDDAIKHIAGEEAVDEVTF